MTGELNEPFRNVQLERTDGLVAYSLRAQPFATTFWTLSAWTDDDALGAFVREMPHVSVMAKLRPHMEAARSRARRVRAALLDRAAAVTP